MLAGGDAVYDHPTPVDQEGTLERTLVSMQQFQEKDFKLVILICPTTPDVEDAAYEQVYRIVKRVKLRAETYLFTAGDLAAISRILKGAGLGDRGRHCCPCSDIPMCGICVCWRPPF